MGNWTIAWRSLADIHRGARISALAALIWCLPACALTGADTLPITPQTAVAQCARSGVVAADVVAGTRFNVNLPTFGDVCFLARRHLASPVEHETDLIGFELWRDGARVYSVPMPPGYLWNELCKKVLAVGFSRHGDHVDIIVLGSCMTAGRDELSQPLIFSSQSGGFRFDDDLSEATMGFDTIGQVQRKIRAMQQNSH